VKSINGIGLTEVQEVYTGPEGDLWELIMGEQIHLGGFTSSQDLAAKAGIGAGQRGVDLCCCNGAGMRFLVRFCEVSQMHGVDATAKVVERGRMRCEQEGMADRISFTVADACDSDLPSDSADFIWGEDAWCYVTDKTRLMAEAARICKREGTLAFTDWIEGPAGLSEAEAERFLSFMKFANIQDLAGYRDLLAANTCQIVTAEYTGRFAPCMDLYMAMLSQQLSYDALKIIDFDTSLMESLGQEMAFIQELAHAEKIAQGLFVARKTGSSQ
jgi:ubiquinone/menaquinone biosynthesis C-methylase UbiE